MLFNRKAFCFLVTLPMWIMGKEREKATPMHDKPVVTNKPITPTVQCCDAKTQACRSKDGTASASIHPDGTIHCSCKGALYPIDYATYTGNICPLCEEPGCCEAMCKEIQQKKEREKEAHKNAALSRPKQTKKKSSEHTPNLQEKLKDRKKIEKHEQKKMEKGRENVEKDQKK